ncbi:MAG: alanine racemase [Patescibacteria group bacterium]
MGSISRENGLRTWIEVDRKAIKHNFDIFKSLIPKKTRFMAVVKSNAYGHGLVDFSKEMERLGADFLGVDSMTEARALRRERIKLPILVLGYTMPALFSEAAENDISLTVSSFETLNALRKAPAPQQKGKPLKIHIKVDTGMHRQGFMLNDLPQVIKNFQFSIFNFQVEGLYTHFAAAKNPAFPKDTEDQLKEFRIWISAFKRVSAGWPLRPIYHAAATAGTMLFPASHLGMVRVGIGLYGLWPAPEVMQYLKGRITLRPALVWKSIITEVKKLPAGSRVGYDLTETLPRASTVAVVPVGYWHGYPRALSSIGRVLVCGKECKILGRVSMDMLIVDVSAVVHPKVGDEVVVMGGKDELPVSAAGLARALDASWYEIVTRLNPLIKRTYL